jgi:hypothetical protein
MQTPQPFLGVALAALLFAGCEDDSLSELHPGIALCASPDVDASSCDGSFDLGELPITLAAPVSVWVKNVGQATLAVSGATAHGPIVVETGPKEVKVGGSEPIALVLTPTELGEGSASLDVVSDDPERPVVTAAISFVGVEKPSSEIELCDVDGDGSCGADIAVAFGSLRRGEERTRAVLVNNIGVVPLHIEEIRLEGETSVPGEIALASSARPGVVEPGGYVPVLLRYRPEDAGEDEVALVFLSDAEENPEARATVTGSSLPNEPPVAAAEDAASGLSDASVVVGETVVVDGLASLDPEGDPLRYLWSLSAPEGSTAALSPEGAGAVAFVPDVAGAYSATLVVEDSLAQQSPPAIVELTARPEHGLRVTLEWTGGGDLDLHLVASGAPFAAGDCYFGQPTLALGDAARDDDDALLLRDAEAAPGREDVVIGVPADGSYQIYVHAFDGLGPAVAEATVSVFLEDGAVPVLVEQQALDEDCALWHVAGALFPEADVAAASTGVMQQCP